MNLELSGLQVVVVGGSYGIGLSVVKGFLAEKAIVHVIARNRHAELISELETAYPAAIYFYACDAINEDSLMATFREIMANSGQQIDIVISNVGNGKGQLVAVSDHDAWKQSWDTNFISALNCARVFTPALTNSKGSLLFISSIAGLEYLGAPTDYATAKSALIAFAKSLSHRLAPDVRVNVVAPGNVLTGHGSWKDKLEKDTAAVNAMLDARVPLKRLGTPEEISHAVLFISSAKASFITGACLVVDGGQTTRFQ